MITTTYIPIFFENAALYTPNVSTIDLGLPTFNYSQQIAVNLPMLHIPEASNDPVIFSIGPVPVKLPIPFFDITIEVDLCLFLQHALYRPKVLGLGFHIYF
jgi:hypothetical protein